MKKRLYRNNNGVEIMDQAEQARVQEQDLKNSRQRLHELALARPCVTCTWPVERPELSVCNACWQTAKQAHWAEVERRRQEATQSGQETARRSPAAPAAPKGVLTGSEA